MASKSNKKIECLNPNTGRKMNIDKNIYELFRKAICHTLKKNKQGITYTDLVTGVKKCFKDQGTIFKGAVGWYTVTVKNDLDATGIIETFTEKGKKIHRLK